MEVQASRASSLIADLKRIVPDVELAMGPLLKVRGGRGLALYEVSCLLPSVACQDSDTVGEL